MKYKKQQYLPKAFSKIEVALKIYSHAENGGKEWTTSQNMLLNEWSRIESVNEIFQVHNST
jgi:hypothetical protein